MKLAGRTARGLVLAMFACGSGGGTSAPGTASGAGSSTGAGGSGAGTGGVVFPRGRWVQAAPDGGFISAVAFDPAQGQPWLSGDDGSGLYRGAEEGGWNLLVGAPRDWSTYAWAFSPDGSVVYAPNHFGRGMARSSDGGATWEVRASLPVDARVHDLAVVPDGGGHALWAATDSGLYRSLDGGDTFEPVQVTASRWRVVRAVEWEPASERLVVGGEAGAIFVSTDRGATFTPILPPGSSEVPISELAAGPNALYIAFDLGILFRTRTYDADDLQQIGADTIASGLGTQLALASGSSAAEDKLYVGTVVGPQGPGGIFVSLDGGASFLDRRAAIGGGSIFDLAVDPAEDRHLLIGTLNDGVWESFDGGVTATERSAGVQAADSLAFAEDVLDPDHIVLSSHTGWPGTGRLWESRDAGVSHSRVDEIAGDVVGMHLRGERLLAGTLRDGVWRRDPSGAVAQVLQLTRGFGRIVADPADPGLLYGATEERLLARDPGDSYADAGVWVSRDGGLTWAQAGESISPALATCAGLPDVVVYGGDDVYLSRDALRTPAQSLGLAGSLAGGSLVLSLACTVDDTLLVGTSASEMFVGTGCVGAGDPCTFQALPTPFSNAEVFALEGVPLLGGGRLWVAAGFQGDLGWSGRVAGLFGSVDGGATWSRFDPRPYPSELAFDVHPSARPGTFYLGLFGGGLLRWEPESP